MTVSRVGRQVPGLPRLSKVHDPFPLSTGDRRDSRISLSWRDLVPSATSPTPTPGSLFRWPGPRVGHRLSVEWGEGFHHTPHPAPSSLDRRSNVPYLEIHTARKVSGYLPILCPYPLWLLNPGLSPLTGHLPCLSSVLFAARKYRSVLP